jgi:hypothetical protein
MAGTPAAGPIATATALTTPTPTPVVSPTPQPLAPSPARQACAEGSVPGAVRPNPRFHYAVAWDEVAGRLFLFGGDDGTISGELWAFCAGTESWELIRPAGQAPSPRYNHTMVWDPERQRLLVFAGVRPGPDGLLNDLWAFAPQNNRWERLSPAGPLPRRRGAHTAVWDPAHDRMLVFAGTFGDAPDLLDDIWAYDPTADSWRRLDATGDAPGPRQGHSAVWARTINRMLVFGGWNFAPGSQPGSNEVWAFDPVSNRWEAISVRGIRPPPRLRHAAVWDSLNDEMLVFGGIPSQSGWLNDLWSFRPGTNIWRERTPISGSPPPTNRIRGAWDPHGSRMFVYGGIGHCFLKDDLWVYSTAGGAWQRVGSEADQSLRREGAAAVYDEETGRLLLFGGCDGSSPRSDLVALSPTDGGVAKLAVQGPAPPPRTDHRAVWDPDARALYVFGGRGPGGAQGGYLGDLWRFRATTGTWEQLQPTGSTPPGRADFAMAWDSSHKQVLLFGGVYGSGTLGDLWAFRPDENRWTRLSGTSGPSSRGYPLGAWDADNERFLIYGGWSQDPRFGKVLFKEVWAYDPAGNQWSRHAQPTAQPSLRTRAVVGWDPSRRLLLLFGGEVAESTGIDTPHVSGELWAWSPSDNAWSLLDGSSAPGPRYQYAAAWDPSGERLIVLGGYGQGFTVEAWEYSSRSQTWQQIK